MPILYAAVFKNSVTVADFSFINGNFNAVAKEYLAKAGRNEGKYAYQVEGTTFSFMTKSGTSFLCVSDDAYGRILPSAFLDKLSVDWETEVGDKLQMPVREGQLTPTYGLKRIKSLMEQITSRPEEFSKLQAVQTKVNTAKEVMMDNMQKMLIRDDKLNEMVDKSSNLLEASNAFQTQGKKLRSHMNWQSMKVKIIVGVALILLALILFLVICFGVAHCFGGDSASPPPPLLQLSPPNPA